MRSHPEYVGLVVPEASFLMHDSNTNVKKVPSWSLGDVLEHFNFFLALLSTPA